MATKKSGPTQPESERVNRQVKLRMRLDDIKALDRAREARRETRAEFIIEAIRERIARG